MATARNLKVAQQIVHLGQSALVFEPVSLTGSQDLLLVITTDQAGTMPGGISLERTDFTRLRRAVADLASARFDFSEWPASGAGLEAIDLSVPPRVFSQKTLGQLARELRELAPVRNLVSPDPIRRLAARLAASAIREDASVGLLSRMIGAGPGTTPSGDDVIVGVLAGLHSGGLFEAAARLGDRVLPLLSGTTRAGAHYLRSAVDGRFGEHVHQVLRSLELDSDPRLTIAIASEWGSTSGVDLLHGLVAALSGIKNAEKVWEAA
ncbi:MAG: DUF2877 domain-containing protein [Cryobacterium sp.]|nr:DUF2877 domain-containing protein [Cryobacterium sp.]MCO5295213.1 DUF2877 domain-containing protein [Homoserinimonas sp.]MCW5945140.1 DUF2877 domain-containing protein [Cryobacterium sp.]